MIIEGFRDMLLYRWLYMQSFPFIFINFMSRDNILPFYNELKYYTRHAVMFEDVSSTSIENEHI